MKTPRIYAIKCTDCQRAIVYSYSELQQPDHCLCYSCMESHVRVADFLCSDGKEFAQVELRRFNAPVLSYHMANDCVKGLQLATVLKLKLDK